VILQATAAGAGTYTLTVNNISGTPPLNGTKCWNGSSSSCTIVISNTPCVEGFECIETSKTYNNLTATPSARNPLHTKLAGSNFKFDIVALQALGVQSTAYTATGNVVVELFDDSATPRPACNAYSSPVASQAITFAATDLGRKTLPANFNLPNTYSKLICRVRDSNLTPNVYGCSSDGFSVRPVAPILSTNAST
jgi:MSHA biogenesis protein MshQ